MKYFFLIIGSLLTVVCLASTTTQPIRVIPTLQQLALQALIDNPSYVKPDYVSQTVIFNVFQEKHTVNKILAYSSEKLREVRQEQKLLKIVECTSIDKQLVSQLGKEVAIETQGRVKNMIAIFNQLPDMSNKAKELVFEKMAASH